MIHDLASHTAAQIESDATLYKQVALRISELIEHGTLRPGERVPSVRKCSKQQNVSIATVMQAYRLLENRGIIERKHTERAMRDPQTGIEDLHTSRGHKIRSSKRDKKTKSSGQEIRRF